MIRVDSSPPPFHAQRLRTYSSTFRPSAPVPVPALRAVLVCNLKHRLARDCFHRLAFSTVIIYASASPGACCAAFPVFVFSSSLFSRSFSLRASLPSLVAFPPAFLFQPPPCYSPLPALLLFLRSRLPHRFPCSQQCGSFLGALTRRVPDLLAGVSIFLGPLPPRQCLLPFVLNN